MLFETCMYSCKHRVFHFIIFGVSKNPKDAYDLRLQFHLLGAKDQGCLKAALQPAENLARIQCGWKTVHCWGKERKRTSLIFSYSVISSCQICPELGNQTVDVLVTNPPLRLSVCSSSCTASRNPFCRETSCIIFWKPLTWWLLTWHINV